VRGEVIGWRPGKLQIELTPTSGSSDGLERVAEPLERVAERVCQIMDRTDLARARLRASEGRRAAERWLDEGASSDDTQGGRRLARR
jgi:hypothetical protein